MTDEPKNKKEPGKRFNWELYERLKKDAANLLELGCDEFAQILVKDYGVKPHSPEFNLAIEIWKKKRGIS